MVRRKYEGDEMQHKVVDALEEWAEDTLIPCEEGSKAVCKLQ
jgi:hypothetical protein